MDIKKELQKEEQVDDWEDNLAEFFAAINLRLEKGSKEYGDIFAEGSDILDEVMTELEDICGWTYQLWRRCKRLKERIKDG